MGFWERRKQEKERKMLLSNVINETIKITGCTHAEAINRYTNYRKSKIVEKLCETDLTGESKEFIQITDMYMTGQVSNDDELLQALIKRTIKPDERNN